MKINNILLSLCGVIILSGCTHKAELISHTDESTHYGTMNDFSDTFDITIRGEKYVGDWSRGFINGTKGGLFKQRGSKGGFLSCQFTLGNSVEYGECTERKNKEKFDITIK